MNAMGARGVTIVAVFGLVLSLLPGEVAVAQSDEGGASGAAVRHEFDGFEDLAAGERSVGVVSSRVADAGELAGDEPLRLVGTLVDGDGPVAGEVVEYAADSDGPFAEVVTDESGRFFFPPEADSPLTLDDSGLGGESGHESYLGVELPVGEYELGVQLAATGEGDGGVQRLFGDGRVDTAVAVSQEAFPQGADVAFVATGYEFPDALTGGPAADQLGGPILLAGEDFLPDETADELARLDVDQIVVLGGEAAVDAEVEAQLSEIAEVSRFAGAERFDTAAQIAVSVYEPGVDTVYVATGMEPWDALSGGAAAALGQGPVVLVGQDLVPDATSEALVELAPGRVVVLGGTEAISDDTVGELDELVDGGVERLSGPSRFDTSAAISAETFAADEVDTVYVATGEEWADALTGVPGAAAVDGPVLLTSQGLLPEVIGDELDRLASAGPPLDIVVLGGTEAVSDEVVDELAEFAGGQPPDLDNVTPIGETATEQFTITDPSPTPTPTPTPDPEVESVTVEPDPVELDEGDSEQLTATAEFDDESTEDVTDQAEWTVEDDAVATVDQDGVLTGQAEGSTTVTASFEGVDGDADATVAPVQDPDPEVESVEVTPDPVELDEGDSEQLTATAVFDDDTTEDVTEDADWASDDETVATVDQDGVLTAVGEGTTTVTATYEDVDGDATVDVEAPDEDPQWPTTEFEDSDGEAWTSHEGELDFLAEVAEGSERMTFEQVGETTEERPLHLVTVALDGDVSADDESMLVVATQHGDEPSGREGALQHLRDMAFTDDEDLVGQLEDISLLYVPTANPDGREADTRRNADDVDTNRDHHLLETAEATAVAEVIGEYDPQMVLDLHERTADGPDMEMLWPRNLNVDEDLQDLNQQMVEEHLFPALEDEGFSTGLYGSPGGAGGGDERISRNVFGLRHTIGLLTETWRDAEPDYRVAAQLLSVEQTMTFFADRFDEVVAETSDAPDRRATHGADQGEFFLLGRDDVDPPAAPEAGWLEAGACGYLLDEDEAGLVDRHVDLFGIETEERDDGGVFIGMGQPAMTIIPYLVDPRGSFNIANGLVVQDCDDEPVLPGPGVYSTDFTEDEHTVGEFPVGWYEYNSPDDGWTVQDDPRRLETVIGDGGRQGVSWFQPGNHGFVDGDVQVAGLVKSSATDGAMFQLALHAWGTGTDYYYVDARPGTEPNTIRINRFFDGSFDSLESAELDLDLQADQLYHVVFDRTGDQLAAKMWPYGEDEPDDWQVTVDDDTHHRGHAGLTHLDEGTVNDWAWISVGTGGEPAERAPDDQEPDPQVETVEVTPDPVEVEVDESEQLTATAVFDDESTQDVTEDADWTSDDTDVATVDDDGLLGGVAEGDTTVTATYEGVDGSADVNVIEPDDGQVYTTDFTDDHYESGEDPSDWSTYRGSGGDWTIQDLPRRLEAITGAGGRQGLMWDVPEDDGVVTGDVEVAGLVRGETTGSALYQLAVQATGNGTDYYYVDSWPENDNIRINKLSDNSFTSIESADLDFEVEEDQWYQVVFRRSGSELAAKMWPFGEDEPSDWSVTTTDDDHSEGQVGITHLNEGTVNDWAWFSVATSGSDAERAPDTVFEPGEDAQVSQVDVDPDSVMVEIDDTVSLNATALYDDGNGYDATTDAQWESADTAVAEVDADGVVTGMGDGTTEVTATYEGVTATAEVTAVDYLPPTTGFEDRDGDEWTTFDEEQDFLAEVADNSERMSFAEAAETPEGRPLNLVKVGYPEAPSDEDIADGQSILVVGSQHGNEPAGREGALRHLRDLAFTQDEDLLGQLDNITVLYIPTANPDGREANTRGNADGTDTNRDHHLLETVEASTVAEMVNLYDPDMVLDLHERPSGSEPDMELLWPRNLNVDEQLRDLNQELVDEHLFTALEDAGYTTGHYGSPTGSGGGDERISRNVFGLRHKIGLLTETAGQDPPMYRVDQQVLTLEEVLAFFDDRFDDVVDQTTNAPDRRQQDGADQEPFYLDGRDDVSPPPEAGIVDPGPCGYLLSGEEAELVEGHIAAFGIETEDADGDDVLIPMDQPMMTIIPFLVDPRASYSIVGGLVVEDCDDLPEPPEPAVYSTSFTEPEHTVDEFPHNWSPFNGPDETWVIQNLPRRLEVTLGSGGRQGVTWNEPGNLGQVSGDVEVAGLVRGEPTGNALFQMAIHASGDGDDYYYVDAWPSDGDIRINRFVDGSFGNIESASAGIEVEHGEWYQVVLSREGDEIGAKMWPFGEEEPDEFQVTATDDSHDSGHIGFTHLNEGTVNDWAWLSVGTGGNEAERAPSDVFEPSEDADLAQVEISPDEGLANIDDTVEFSASAVWEDGNGLDDVTAEATWASADESVVTIDADGVATGVGEGSTEISATYEEVTGTAAFTVDADYVQTEDGSHSFDVGQVSTSEGGMVSAADGRGADVGAQILGEGGNAVDAAVATAFAQTVVEPTMSHLGGRTQMLIRLPDGEYVGIDGGTEVPGNYDAGIAPPSHDSGRGYGTIALPGVVAALMEAHEDHGSMALEDVMAPAISLAADGSPLSARQADTLEALAAVDDPQYEAAQGYFLREDGTPYEPGDVLVQEDLAGVLEAIADDGAEVFYEGWIAETIAADMDEFGGFLNEENLADYSTDEGVLIDGSYKGHDMYSLYDPSRGQVTIQSLQMMDHFAMDECAPDAGWTSVVHQNYQIGMEDRSLPPDEVTSLEHAELRAADVEDHCTVDDRFTADDLDEAAAWPASDELDPQEESPDTTHLSTADPDGMAVTLTQTIGPANGSMVATEGLGFLYASTMGYAGSVPGTRPSTNLTPMIVEQDGELAYVLGASGGARIVSAVKETLARTIDTDVSFAEALAAPRFHSTGDDGLSMETDPDLEVSWPDETIAGLMALDYDLTAELGGSYGRVHSVHYDSDTEVFTGVADPRREGMSAGP